MSFEIISDIHDAETFASGFGIRELPRLKRLYGNGFWRKRKGTAEIRLPDGALCRAELHWYEASGIILERDYQPDSPSPINPIPGVP